MYTSTTKHTEVKRQVLNLLDRSLLQRESIDEVLTVEFQGSWDKIHRTEE